MLRVQIFFTALPLAFGTLHLLLYAALPRLRSNLYYGLFLLFIAATIYLDFEEQRLSTVDHGRAMSFLYLHRLSLAASFIFGTRFFYEAFLGHAPRQYPLLAGALAVTGVMAFLDPLGLFWPLQLTIIAGLIDTLRVMARAVRQRRDGARLIAGGMLAFATFASYDFLLDFSLISPVGELTNAYQFGLVGLFLATSTYLARNIARTTSQLLEHERLARDREVERRLLEAEVSRTTAELEQARTLQLSLLPTSLPESSSFEAAAYLETASEVGGDYYDFRRSDDTLVTIAVGDATGHGLRAGFMVAVAKSLFQGLADGEPLISFFNRCTDVIKPMGLGNLYMGLTLMRYDGRDATISAAGMPPILIRRAANEEVEVHTLKGMPIGAFHGFPYQEVTVRLHPGDAVLLMSDGMMELFNEEREMLGLERVATAFGDADGSAADVVARLRQEVDAWRGSHRQEDDVTIVVVRRKADGGGEGEGE